MQHSPEIIQIEESDEELIHYQTKEIIEETDEAKIVQPIEPSIDESIEGMVEATVEQEIEAVRREVEPEDITEDQNVEEIRCEAAEDVQAPELESILAEPMVEDQTSEAKSPEILVGTPSEQPKEDDNSDVPYSNMSCEEFERC